MNKRILIAEDATVLANAVKKQLENSGFEVEHAPDGKVALQMLSEGHFDLMILDINMPQLNGFEVADAVKELGYDLNIIALTARDGMQDKLSGFERGFDDYMTKPFDTRELIARINAILRRKGTDQPKKLCAGDIVVDIPARLVTRKKEEVGLTKLEFQLLLLLMSRSPAVVENSEIIDNLWDDDVSTSEPPVRSHIKNLRKKLGDDDFSLIVTIPGVGYKISNVEEC